MRLAGACALLFGSGFAALVYQTVWQRLFCLIFGASTGASAAVLAIFLGGLGFGGLWLGKRAEKSPRPLLFYANLEAIVVVCAAVTPLLSDLAARIYFMMGGSSSLGSVGATVVRLLLATLVIGPATVAMGGTLPAMARAAENDGDTRRERLAQLYAVNTLGAVVGSLLGTFLLFEVLGHEITLWFACLINALVALIARVWGRRLPELNDAPQSGEMATTSPAELRGSSPSKLPSSTTFAYAIAGVVGLAFLMLEMIWYRMLGPLLGGTTYTFGIILAVALTGIGLGGYWYSRRAERVVTLYTLASTLALEAVLAAIPFALGDRIALFAAYTRSMASMGFSGLVVSWVLIAGMVVLPVSLISGYQFPVLFALLGQGRQGVAEQVGRAYAFNTVGSILGALLAGFVIIPRLGAVDSWRAVVVLLALAAAVSVVMAWLREPSKQPGRTAAALGLVTLAITALFSLGPTGVWRHEPIGAGRAAITSFDRNSLKQWLGESRARTVWEADGKESSVRLSDNHSYAFSINGKCDGSVWEDRGTQSMLAVLPTLLHPQAKSAFVVGLGTGMSAGWLAKLDAIERVDVAELEPAILKVAEAAKQANGDPLANPKVHVFLGDAREYMLTSKAKYDVIASEPSNPYRAGIASLFTLEFYRVVAEHLNEGGIFAQWVQGYEVDVATLRTVTRTIREVFPSVEIWQSQAGDFEIIASKIPRRYSRADWERKLAEPVLQDLVPRVWMVEGVEGLLSHFVADTALVQEITDFPEVVVNTDDANVLEYAFARTVGNASKDGVLELLEYARSTGRAHPAMEGEVDWGRVDELRGRAWMINEGNVPALANIPAEARQRIQAIADGCGGDGREVASLWSRQSRQDPLDIVETYVLALSRAAQGDEAAGSLAGKLAKQGFLAEALLVEAQWLAVKGDLPKALERLTLSLREQRKKALPLCSTAKRTLRLLDEVSNKTPEFAKRASLALLEGPLAAHVSELARVDVAERLGYASRDPHLCVKAMGPRAVHPHWTEGFLYRRYECLKAVQSPLAESAEEDLLEFLSATPGTFASGTAPKPSMP